VRHSRAALSELQFVKDVKRQPRDLGQLPRQGRFSPAGVSEYGHSFHGALHYHAKKRSSVSGHEWRNSN
jgi:hypothetical protein